MLHELAKEGLCGEAEAGAARHEQAKCAAEARYLMVALAQLEKQGDSVEPRRAEVKVRKLGAELRIAELRKDLESQRRRLVCDATRLAEVGQARRELQLADKRLEALTVRSPGAGYVLYGDREEYWYHPAGQRYVPGTPIYYGELVASVIDPARVHVEVEIKEEELLRVTTGDRAEVRLPAVAGQLYEGAVKAVLPIVRTSQREIMETATEVQRRYGVVDVTLAQSDERVRPGMKAVVSIFPRSVTKTAQAGHVKTSPDNDGGNPGPRAGQAGSRPDLVLSGHLETKSVHYVETPIKGRIMWLAPRGALVKKGETLARLEPGLEEDWRARDESELQRLTYLRQAAELQVQLKEQLVPLLREDAEADVTLAELSLEELNARPEAPDRVKAENELAEAEWQLQGAGGKLDAYRDLAAQGWASEADVKKVELQLASAEAGAAMARAKLAEVLSGASALEKAIAQADLKVARTSLEKANALAEVEAAAARAELEAATARLQAYRAQADRRRRKAEQAEVKSPVSGIAFGSWVKEGQEVEAGWYLMAVADMEQALIYAMLDESDYSKVHVGSPARVKLAGVPDRAFAGRVAEVVDWPDIPIWYQRTLTEDRVRPAKLFRAVVELEDKPPTCVGMSAVVEIFSPPAGAEGVRVDSGQNRPAESEASHKDGKPD
jgi:multidrug resistance efflux pump